MKLVDIINEGEPNETEEYLNNRMRHIAKQFSKLFNEVERDNPEINDIKPEEIEPFDDYFVLEVKGAGGIDEIVLPRQHPHVDKLVQLARQFSKTYEEYEAHRDQ